MEEKKGKKKTIIINGKEFETYSPLTSDILKCVSYADKVNKADQFGLIEKYFNFILRWWWFIIVFMIFALFTNGGIQCDIVIGIVLIVSIIWGKYYSECNIIAIKFNFLGSESYSWDSFEAADNTLKEADYLIPKLKECEKQTDETVRWKLYLELVKEMDEKYGERKHMLGKPYSKEEKRKDKEYSELDDARKQAREYACKDVITVLIKVKELYEKVWKGNEKSIVDAQLKLFDLINYLHSYHNNSITLFKEHYKYNLLNSPPKACFNEFDKTYNDIYESIIGHPYYSTNSFEKWGLSELITLHTKRIFKDLDISYPYYNENDLAACLEGKMVYEVTQKINEYPEIKEIYDNIGLFPKITNEMYQMMCEKVKESNFGINDLKERMV